MELILGLCLGVSLAAACGFRIFVPLLVMGVAHHSGQLELAEGFEWIGSTPAIATFLIATIVEIAAYYIPAVDNALDTVATPAAVVAGTVVTAACVQDMSPLLTWSLAAIVGGGAAATVQGMTAVTRLTSTATTGGLGNSVLSTAEAGGSVALASLGVLAPVIAALCVVSLLYFTITRIARVLRRRREAKVAAPAAPAARPVPEPAPQPMTCPASPVTPNQP